MLEIVYDVFISAGKADYPLARKLYDYLSAHGLRVFFGDALLPVLETSDYRRAIDRVLDSVHHMLVVTSAKEHVMSPWVEAEWGFFINEKRAGRKPGNVVTMLAPGREPTLLPPSLRYYEVLTLDAKGMEMLPTYLGRDGKPVARRERPSVLEKVPATDPAYGEAQEAKLLPPISLLSQEATKEKLPIDHELIGQTIINTLKEFGIKVTIKAVETGPAVTVFELLPEPGVKVEKIAGLSNNLALSLKASSIRVQAPIPGRNTAGIEVPNVESSSVTLREILEGAAWQPSKMALPVALGRDVADHDVVADLTTMPHLLIAGKAGSGKTVCINSILTGLLMSRTSQELQLILIDPTNVDFQMFNGLSHLLGAGNEVLSDPKRAIRALRWLIDEMERRYKQLALAGVRNIKAFNTRPIETVSPLSGEGSEVAQLPRRLPYIVMVVNELADLMLQAQAETENYIARLAQLSRAVGIHMILVTERPVKEVITGTIKANFPARIAFQLAERKESLAILDANGADKLLGRGDMLFLPPGAAKLIRAQGAMTESQDIQGIADYLRKQHPPQAGDSAVSFEPVLSSHGQLERLGGVPADMDEADSQMIDMAAEIVRETQRASTSSLQRRLRIGYTRAARLMDELERRGAVGPARGSDPREVFIR